LKALSPDIRNCRICWGLDSFYFRCHLLFSTIFIYQIEKNMESQKP